MKAATGVPPEVVERLALAGCVAPEEEAAEMVSATADRDVLLSWLERRERGEPLAWITGRTDFGGATVRVATGVYVPRQETVILARRAAQLLRGRPAARAADLCTGSGAVAVLLAALAPGAAVVATDVDASAVACARTNGVAAVRTDLACGLKGRSFDVVTAVAPYVPSGEMRYLPADVQRYEPRLALDGGHDGLAVLRRLVPAASRVLRAAGSLLLEIGGDQMPEAERLLAGHGFGDSGAWTDDDGDIRGIEACLVDET